MLQFHTTELIKYELKSVKPRQIGIILQFFCRKLHENERNLTPWGARPGVPLRSANDFLRNWPRKLPASRQNFGLVTGHMALKFL